MPPALIKPSPKSLKPTRAKGIVHEQIAKTAKALAAEHWEQLAKDNRFYRAWPEVEVFVAKCWPHYIDMTRAMFAGMLGDPKHSTEMKDQLRDVLLLDGTVNPKKLAEPEKPTYFALTKS